MPRAKLELRIGFLLNIRFYAYISMVQYLGAARLELAKTEVERFTVSCNCRYATPPKLLAKGIEPSTVRLQVGCSTN